MRITFAADVMLPCYRANNFSRVIQPVAVEFALVRNLVFGIHVLVCSKPCIDFAPSLGVGVTKDGQLFAVYYRSEQSEPISCYGNSFWRTQ